MSTATTEARIPTITLGWRLKIALGEVQAGEMADHLGVSRQTLSRWMSDKGSAPSRAYILQWAMRTGVDARWLETGETPDDRPDGPEGTPVSTHQYLRQRHRSGLVALGHAA